MSRKEVIERIKDFCNKNGYAFIWFNCGFWMYERMCAGIVCDNPAGVLKAITADLVENGDGIISADIKEDLMASQYDIGHTKILYFPKIEKCC